jgi:hypothetical protein
MRRWLLAPLALLLTAVALVSASAVSPATPVAEGTPFACPISEPNDVHPPDQDAGSGDFGNDALWTNLAMWGEVPGIVEVPHDGHLLPDGRVIELKWAWWRFGLGILTIDGRRLDAPAPPLEAWIPDGYGATGFQVSGITFPTDGCWEVTGRVRDDSLTFVVQVIYPAGFVPSAAPPAATDCPVTQPNGVQPPAEANVFGRGNGDYGNAYLWTSLWMWGEGVVQAPDDGRILPDGTIPELKWAWYQFVPGKLTIEGRRLDAPAPPLQASMVDGYGDVGFHPTGLTFPSDGCWEITGQVEGWPSLTFIVLVVYPDGFSPSASAT